MKRLVFTAIALSFMVLASCGLEGKAEKAWKDAQKATDLSTQRLKQKEAYAYYSQAYEKAQGKASAKLLNGYLKSAITRIGNYFEERKSATDQQVETLRKEIEKVIKLDGVSVDTKDAYAKFLISVAQNYREKGDISNCIKELDNAKPFSADKSVIEALEAETRIDQGKAQLSIAKGKIEAAKKSRDPVDYINAEYYAKVALHFDSTNADAQTVLAQARKELVQHPCIYKVVIEYSDTALFKAVNSDRVTLAVSAIKAAKGETVLDVKFFNDSWKAINPKPNLFKLVLTNGQEVVADKSVFERKLLEQEKITDGKVTFKGSFSQNDIKVLTFADASDEKTPVITGNKYLQ
jgi:hypothetical protein